MTTDSNSKGGIRVCGKLKMRNIEIKAKIHNLPKFLKAAAKLSNSSPTVIKQHDTFYTANNGRLKLRRFENGAGELIQYDRPDLDGPKLSSFEKVSIAKESVDGLHSVLERALGITGDVKKVRNLFLVGQTRVHVDTVEGLGDFMELEVVLNDHQTVDEGQEIAHKLMESLEVSKEDLISGAYTDLIAKLNK